MPIKSLGNFLKGRWLSVFMFGFLLILPGAGYGGIVDFDYESLPSNVFVIAIGINTYQKQPLQYARADAIAISGAIEKAYPGILIHKHVVLDEQATRQSIAAAFEKVIASSRPDDIFVFHFSGYHSFEMGGGSEEEFYLLPANVTPLFRKIACYQTALRPQSPGPPTPSRNVRAFGSGLLSPIVSSAARTTARFDCCRLPLFQLQC